jgi:hypothetical protein
MDPEMEVSNEGVWQPVDWFYMTYLRPLTDQYLRIMSDPDTKSNPGAWKMFCQMLTHAIQQAILEGYPSHAMSILLDFSTDMERKALAVIRSEGAMHVCTTSGSKGPHSVPPARTLWS